MPDSSEDDFDLDGAITARLDGEPDTDTSLQALAVLFDAELTDAGRAAAFEGVMANLLAKLSPDELDRFRAVAESDGEAAAMSYLGAVTRPVPERDRS